MKKHQIKFRGQKAVSSVEFIAVFPSWLIAFFLLLGLYFLFVNGIMLQNALAQATLRIGASGCNTELIRREYNARASAAGAYVQDYSDFATPIVPGKMGSARPIPEEPLKIEVYKDNSWEDITDYDCLLMGEEDEVEQGSFLRITGSTAYRPLSLPGIKLTRSTVVLAQSVKTTGEMGR